MSGRLRVRVHLPLDRFALDVGFETSHRVTGVFGRSGSGKTSLLETVVGLRRRATGRLSLDDETWLDSADGTYVRPEGRHVGYVPQEGLLFPHWNVRRNLLAGADRRRAHEGPSTEETFRAVVDLLELSPYLSRDVVTLSGGERQRVALGRALCSRPRLLLLDEPLASLDLRLRRRVLPFLRRIRDEFRIPMLLVSHDPVEVQALCDDLIVLGDGAIIGRGAPRDVLTDPAIFPIAEQEGYQNVLPCAVEAHEGDTSIVRLGANGKGPRLVVPRATGEPGSRKLVGLPAREVILATEEPKAISAQNVLRAEVHTVRSVGPLRLVHACLDEDVPDIAVEVTEQARDALGLRSGRVVYLIVKAAGCILYDPGGAGEAEPEGAAAPHGEST